MSARCETPEGEGTCVNGRAGAGGVAAPWEGFGSCAGRGREPNQQSCRVRGRQKLCWQHSQQGTRSLCPSAQHGTHLENGSGERQGAAAELQEWKSSHW